MKIKTITIVNTEIPNFILVSNTEMIAKTLFKKPVHLLFVDNHLILNKPKQTFYRKSKNTIITELGFWRIKYKSL